MSRGAPSVDGVGDVALVVGAVGVFAVPAAINGKSVVAKIYKAE
jgi:hypothetical protein